MKVAVVGSRTFTNYKVVKTVLDTLRKTIQFDMIISGGAVGVDEMAYKYAVENGITFVCHPPKPEDGQAKFKRRNLRIVEQSEIVIAFHARNSSGTAHSIGLAKKLGKQLKVYTFST